MTTISKFLIGFMILAAFAMPILADSSPIDSVAPVSITLGEPFYLAQMQAGSLTGDGILAVVATSVNASDSTVTVALNWGPKDSLNGRTPNQFVVLKTNESTAVFAGQSYEYSIQSLGIEEASESVPKAKLVITKTSSPGLVYANLNEEFSLVPYQKAVVSNENLTILLASISSTLTCQGTGCPPSILFSKITVTQSRDGTGVSTEFILNSGQSAEAFGYTIRNTSMTSGSAKFIVTKNTSIPDSLQVKLGNPFTVVPNQTAAVLKNNETLMKMTVDKLTSYQVQCFTTPCDPINSASVSFSFPDGTGIGFLIQNHQTISIRDNYEIEATAMSSDKATFVIREKTSTTPADIIVNLDTDFDLNQSQIAWVKETGLRIEFIKVGLGSNCPKIPEEGKGCTANLIPYAVLSVSQSQTSAPMPIFIPQMPISTTGIQSDSKPSWLQSGQYVTLYPGQSATVFGQKITLNRLLQTNLLDASNALGYIANLRVSQQTAGSEIVAYLNQKFSLSQNQTANVDDLLKVRVESIDYLACIQSMPDDGSPYKCDERPVVVLYLQPNEYWNSTTVKLREGEERTIGEFTVSLLDVLDFRCGPTEKCLNVGSAVLLVRKVSDQPYQKVNLDQKFKLLPPSQTVLVVGPDIFVRMTKLLTLESEPVKYVAYVQVWKSGYYETAPISVVAEMPAPVPPSTTNTNMPYANGSGGNSGADSSDQIAVGIASPTRTTSGMIQYAKEAYFEYKLSPGGSIDVYGATLSFLASDGKTGEFVMSSPDTPPVLNVHVNDSFRLETGWAARVLEANMRIDLLGITYGECDVPDSNESQPDSNFVLKKCKPNRVTISVSNYYGATNSIGKSVAPEIASQTVVSEKSASKIVEISDSSASGGSSSGQVLGISLPPRPVETYELYEGQEVTINDFTIRVLSISGNFAEFVVESKPSNSVVHYEIQNGWNLFSMPGDLSPENNNCNTSEWKLYEYNKEQNSFSRVKEPKPGKAYWLNNSGKACSVKAGIRNPVTVYQLDLLSANWNFVPITTDMIGKKITELGDCQVRVAYQWNAAAKKWQKVTTETINESHLGGAFAVYVQNACSLGGPTGENPPPLPPLEEQAQ